MIWNPNDLGKSCQPLLLVPICHIWAPPGDVVLPPASFLYLFAFENVSAFRVTLPFPQILNVFPTWVYLKLCCCSVA